MEFRTETIREFNSHCDTTLTEEMSFEEAVDNIDNAGNSYFYISMAKEDVIEAVENEKDIARQLDLEAVYIKELGIYITLHP